MAMSSERPVNLDLTTFHFPVTAIASILHRVCGVILFFWKLRLDGASGSFS